MYIEKSNSKLRIFRFLEVVDSSFSPSLSSRVKLDDYALKLSNLGINFFFFDGLSDLGHASVYINDSSSLTAFLTSIAVKDRIAQKGIGKALLQAVILEVKRHKYKKIKLEVSKENVSAIGLYEKYGFKTISTSDISFIMILSLD